MARVGLAVALLAYAALAYGYVRLTPIWQNPDEPAHYNYVAFVAQTGGLPELRAGDWDSALLERLKNGALQPGDSIGAIRYESWQPPLAYLVAAPIYRLSPTDAPAPTLLRLRALDAVLGGLTLVVAYFVAREATQPGLAAAVPLTMVGVPMFTAVSAALSADPLANLIAAVTLLPLARRTRCPSRATQPRWALLVGFLVGLGLLAKLELAIFVPILIGVIVVRSQRPLRETLIALATLAVVVSPWLVHQVTTYGLTDPLAIGRHSQVVADQPRFPGFGLDWLSQFLTTSFHSFWAQFGWMAVVAPPRLYLAWGVVTLVAVIGLVLGRRGFARPVWRLLLATVAVALVAYLGYNLSFEQFQGRYLFTALVPIAALLVLGWSTVLPRRGQPWSVLLVAGLLVGLNAYALLRVLVPGLAPPGA